jgi:hypothetical protein
MKALHLHRAFAAVDSYSSVEYGAVEMIPTKDEVMKLQDDLILGTTGLMWSK